MASRLKYPRRRVPSLWPFNMLLFVLLVILGAIALWIASGNIAQLGR